MKYSIIVTYYDPDWKKLRMLADCVESIRLNTDVDYELIVVHNGPSYVESVNQGLRRAKGDHIIVMNDDTVVLDRDWIGKLTNEEAIMTWQMGKFHLIDVEVPDAACFSMSRHVMETIGEMDEVFKDGANFEDTDYFFRAMDLGIPFLTAPGVIKHIGNVTQKIYGTQHQELVHRNHSIFYDKWKSKLEPVRT